MRHFRNIVVIEIFFMISNIFYILYYILDYNFLKYLGFLRSVYSPVNDDGTVLYLVSIQDLFRLSLIIYLGLYLIFSSEFENKVIPVGMSLVYLGMVEPIQEGLGYISIITDRDYRLRFLSDGPLNEITLPVVIIGMIISYTQISDISRLRNYRIHLTLLFPGLYVLYFLGFIVGWYTFLQVYQPASPPVWQITATNKELFEYYNFRTAFQEFFLRLFLLVYLYFLRGIQTSTLRTDGDLTYPVEISRE